MRNVAVDPEEPLVASGLTSPKGRSSLGAKLSANSVSTVCAQVSDVGRQVFHRLSRRRSRSTQHRRLKARANPRTCESRA